MSTLRSAYRRARWKARCAMGRDVRFPLQTRVATELHGSAYGGWRICPTGLQAGAIVYSAGVGTDITFDLSLIEAHGVTVHAFDPTPASIEYLKTQRLPASFHWHRLGLSQRDGTASFFPPADPSHISHTLVSRPHTAAAAIEVDVRRLSTIMTELGHDRIDILKMDIEGAEYEVLDEIVSRRLPVRQLLVEFHHRFAGISMERTKQAVEALNGVGYRIFSISDTGEEYGFLQTSGIEGSSPVDWERSRHV